MMKYFINCFVILTMIGLFSCENQANLKELNCDKLKSREEAENLIIELNDDHLIDSTTIAENLIGTWGLIGMVPGWIGFESGQECIRLTIDSNTIELEDLNTGTNKSSDWELKTFEVNGYVGFYLETNEEVWNNRMGMELFSEGIMLGSGRVDDGNIYIYEKMD